MDELTTSLIKTLNFGFFSPHGIKNPSLNVNNIVLISDPPAQTELYRESPKICVKHIQFMYLFHPAGEYCRNLENVSECCLLSLNQ